METKSTLNVALVQASPAWENWLDNQIKYGELLRPLVNQSVDLIVLPEMFSTGFTMSPKAVAQSNTGQTVEWMLEQARQLNSYVVGSIVTEDRGAFYNRMYWAGPEGTLQYYDKKHLFTFAGEDHQYTPGETHCIVDIHGWKFASFICFDLRFPAWCRNTANQSYDVAVFIASWPQVRREHWATLLRARAIENQAYVIGVNRVGQDGNSIDYCGDSQVIDGLGNVQVSLAHNEAIHIASLDRSDLNAIKIRFPFLKEADKFTLC